MNSASRPDSWPATDGNRTSPAAGIAITSSGFTDIIQARRLLHADNRRLLLGRSGLRRTALVAVAGLATIRPLFSSTVAPRRAAGFTPRRFRGVCHAGCHRWLIARAIVCARRFRLRGQYVFAATPALSAQQQQAALTQRNQELQSKTATLDQDNQDLQTQLAQTQSNRGCCRSSRRDARAARQHDLALRRPGKTSN